MLGCEIEYSEIENEAKLLIDEYLALPEDEVGLRC